MEPRTIHELPAWLGAWLQDRCPQGLGVPEAECLCLRMYYKFDGIPMALRHQLSRVTLASTFAELARRGWVCTANGVRRRRLADTAVLAAFIDTELSPQRTDLRLRARGSGVSPAPAWPRLGQCGSPARS